jgi:hypothetical protein
MEVLYMVLTEELKQQMRQENKEHITVLNKQYTIYNSFEIFMPLMPEFHFYLYQEQIKYYKELLKYFEKDNNRVTIYFNKSDIDIITLDKIINKCYNLDIRIQKYL